MIKIRVIKYRILSWLYILIGKKLMSIESSVAFNISIIENKIGVYFNTPDYTKNKTRERSFVIARQVLATVLRNNTDMTFREIGKYICNQTHDNIIHAQKQIDNLVDTNHEFKVEFYRLMRNLNVKYEKYYQSRYVRIKR